MTCNRFINIYLICVFLFSHVSCDVGTVCTAPDVIICDGAQGTGYLCDTSNTCQCTTNYYDSSQICTAKQGFGETCNSTTECLGNMNCSSDTDGTCGCYDNQYHDNNNCIYKPGFSEACNSNTGCLGNLICPSDNNGNCGCDDTYYHDGNNICVQKPGFNEACNSTTGCLGNLTCLTNGKCGCDDTYYHDGSNMCLLKPGFNTACTSTTGCLGNLTCSSDINGYCGCDDTRYHDGNNNCVEKPGFNGACTSNTGCLGNLKCLPVTNRICGCDNTYYHDGNNNCVQKPGFNGICTSTTGCLGNLTCSPDTGGKCGCDNTYYHDGNNNCLQKPGCTSTTGCLGNLKCLSNGNCGCDNTYYHDGNNMCLLRAGYEGICTSTTGCLGNLTCSSNGKCGCDDTYYHDGNNNCIEKPGFNTACTSTTGCLGNLTCSSNNNGNCGCDDTRYHDGNNNCVEKKVHGETCTTPDSCNLESGGCDAVTSTCLCNDNYYKENNIVCKPVADLKSTGVMTESLTSSSVTIKWTVPMKDAIQSFIIKGTGPNIEKTGIDKAKRMVTITGLTPNTQYTNIKVETVVKTDRNPSLVTSDSPFITFTTSKAGYKETCVQTGPVDQCIDTNSECVEIPTGSGYKCYCKIGFYTNNNQCYNASSLKTTITNVDPKTDAVTVTWILPSNSQFITSFSIEVNDTINKDNIGNTATSSEITGLLPGTGYIIKVISIVNTDRNPTFEVQSDQQSTTKQVTGSSCNLSNQPCTGNLTCISNVCGCEIVDYVFNNYCYSKLDYDGDCSNSDQACKTGFVCYKEISPPRCKCKPGEYKSGNHCISVSKLKPTNFRVEDSNASSLTFSWNVLHDTYINEYIISGDSFQDTTILNTARIGIVTGLLQGTDYTNIKITARVRTDRGTEVVDVVSDQTLADNTNPGKPGALNSNDYNTSKIMNIGFGKPDGGVNSYSVEIIGPGLDTPFQQGPTTNNIIVPANTLQSGRTYAISIIAVYKGKHSVPLTDNFLTLSTGSDPVKDLAISNIHSRNLTVSWSYPDEDMGALTSYILDVINNGNECVQHYIYQYVTDTNTPTSTICVGVTPIYITKDLKADVTQEITDLLPYINYTLIVTPYNAAGRGSQASKSVLTAIEAAGEPSNLNVPEIKATSFLVTWNKPDLKTGPTTYFLNVYERNNLVNNQATQLFKKYAVQGFDKVNYRVIGVVSYWYYRVELQASTSVGNSSIKNIPEFQTLSSAPGKVKNLAIEQISGLYTTAKVSWFCPNDRDRHGIIKNYTLTSTLDNEIPEVIQHQESCRFTKTVGVKAGEATQFVVYATNMGFKGEEAYIDFVASAENSADDSISPTVIGIVVALVLIIAAMVIGIVIYCLVKRRRSTQKGSEEGTVNYTPTSDRTPSRENSTYINLPKRNADLETAAYYVNLPKRNDETEYVNVPEHSNNGQREQGPYASLDDDLTPSVYETLQ